MTPSQDTPSQDEQRDGIRRMLESFHEDLVKACEPKLLERIADSFADQGWVTSGDRATFAAPAAS